MPAQTASSTAAGILLVAALLFSVSALGAADLPTAASGPLGQMEDFLILRERVLSHAALDPAQIETLESRLEGLARSTGTAPLPPARPNVIPSPTKTRPLAPSSASASAASTAAASIPPVVSASEPLQFTSPSSDTDLQIRLFLQKGYSFLGRKGGLLAEKARRQARNYLGACRPKPKNCTYYDSGGLKVIIRGDPNVKEIALTFDDGPIEGHSTERGTRAILSVLAQTQSKATFFVGGGNAQAYPELLKFIRKSGHTIANHTKTHARGLGLPRLSIEGVHDEVGTAKRMIQKAMGGGPIPLFRLPYGAGVHTERVNRIIAEYHDYNIFWTIDSRDWQRPGYAHLIHSVLDSNQINGAIVLFHDHGQNVPAAVQTIINTLKPRGYRFVTVEELLGIDQQTTFLEGFERAAGKAEAGQDQIAYDLFLQVAQEAPSMTLAREALDFAYLVARLSLGLEKVSMARSLLSLTFGPPSPDGSPRTAHLPLASAKPAPGATPAR